MPPSQEDAELNNLKRMADGPPDGAPDAKRVDTHGDDVLERIDSILAGDEAAAAHNLHAMSTISRVDCVTPEDLNRGDDLDTSTLETTLADSEEDVSDGHSSPEYLPSGDEHVDGEPAKGDEPKKIVANGKAYVLGGRKKPQGPHIDSNPSTPLRRVYVAAAEPISGDTLFLKRRAKVKVNDGDFTDEQMEAIERIKGLRELLGNKYISDEQKQGWRESISVSMQKDPAVREYFDVHGAATSTKVTDFKTFALHPYYERASEATDAVHFAATQHIKPHSKGAAEKALAISAVLASASHSLDWLGQALIWVRDENPHINESAEDYQGRCDEAVSLAVTAGDKCDKKRPKVHHLAPHATDIYRARSKFERSLAHQQWEEKRK